MDVVASAPRHPGVGETVAGTGVRFSPGGKGANQAVAAARAGARVVLCATLGGDRFGDDLEAFLVREGLDRTFVRRAHEEVTGTALIVVAGSDNTIVVCPGANARTSADDVGALEVSTGDVLVAQLEIPVETVNAFFARGRECTTILNAAPARALPDELLARTRILVVNETELAELGGAGPVDQVAARVRGARDQIVVVTLGSGGVAAITAEGSVAVPGHAVPVVDTTGAGDCFVGVLASAVCDGVRFEDALRRANAAAAICVQRPGASPAMPVATEVDAFLA